MTPKKLLFPEKMEVPKVPIKRKVNGKIYQLHGTFKGKYQVLTDAWEVLNNLKRAGYEVGYEEKIQGVGKRKPVAVTLIWVSKP